MTEYKEELGIYLRHLGRLAKEPIYERCWYNALLIKHTSILRLNLSLEKWVGERKMEIQSCFSANPPKNSPKKISPHNILKLPQKKLHHAKNLHAKIYTQKFIFKGDIEVGSP